MDQFLLGATCVFFSISKWENAYWNSQSLPLEISIQQQQFFIDICVCVFRQKYCHTYTQTYTHAHRFSTLINITQAWGKGDIHGFSYSFIKKISRPN